MTDVRHTKSVSIQQKFKGGRGVAQPTSTMMQLGAVAHLAPSEDSELGRQIIAMVMRARGAAGNKPAARAPLTFAAYKEAIQKLDSIKRALHQEHHSYNDVYVPGDGPELRRFVKMYNVERHTSDFGGYVNYVGAVHDAMTQQRTTSTQMSSSCGPVCSAQRSMISSHHASRSSAFVVASTPVRTFRLSS